MAVTWLCLPPGPPRRLLQPSTCRPCTSTWMSLRPSHRSRGTSFRPPITTDEEAAAFLRDLNLPPEALHEAMGILKGPSALEVMEVGCYLRKVVQSTLTGSWMTTQGISTLAQTGRGTKPGDPLGDLLFTIAFTRVLRRIRADMLEAGLGMPMPYDPTTGPIAGAPSETITATDVSFADDADLFVLARLPSELIAKARLLLRIVDKAYAAHKLCINYSRGKTELAMVLRGYRARREWAEVAREGGIPFETSSGAQVVVRVTRAYKHLGCLADPSLRMKPEIVAKATAGRAAVRRVRKAISMPGLHKDTRYTLVDTLVNSAMFYGAEVWHYVTPDEAALLDAVQIDAWRSIEAAHNAGRSAGSRVTDLTILSISQRMPAGIRIRFLRMRAMPRLARVAPAGAWALLQAAGGLARSWVSMVVADIDALLEEGLLPPEAPSARLTEQPAQWFSYFKGGADGWKQAAMRLARAAVGRRCSGIRDGGERERHAPLPDEAHRCDCGVAFASLAALRAHQLQRHGRKSRLRALAFSPQCPLCLLHCHTRERLVHHYRRARCGRLIISLAPMSDEVVRDLDMEDAAGKRALVHAGRHDRFADKPAIRAEGPAHPITLFPNFYG